MTSEHRLLTEVTEGVLVATSRTDATNSTVICDGPNVLLVDPGWHPDELSGLAGELARRELEVTAGFSTHAHHDHLLWHPDFGDAPRWASPHTCELATEHRDELLSALGGWPWPDSFGRITPLTGHTLPSPFGPEGHDEPIAVITHNGHAPGHSAIWLPERRVLLAGDMLSDIELPLPFWPDDLPSYLEALELLAPFVSESAFLIPGHGSPTTHPGARLDADRRYLEAVIGGHASSDPRLENPGMAVNHAHLVEMTRG